MQIAYLYGQKASLELELIMTTLEREYWASRLKAILDCKEKDEASVGIKLLHVAATETLSIPQEDRTLTTLRDNIWCQADWVNPMGPLNCS